MPSIADFTAREILRFERRMTDAHNRSLNGLMAGFSPTAWSDFLDSEPLAVCLVANQHVRKLFASLARKAKGPRAAMGFRRLDADYHLLSAVCIGLALFADYTQSGTVPNVISKADWDRGIAAAKTLRQLERKGLRVSRVFAEPPNHIPFDWLDQMVDRLEEGRQSSRKVHGDEFSADRAATREFVYWMLPYFGEAPLAMVQIFAELIGYSPEAARKRLPGWISDYRTHSLT